VGEQQQKKKKVFAEPSLIEEGSLADVTLTLISGSQ